MTVMWWKRHICDRLRSQQHRKCFLQYQRIALGSMGFSQTGVFRSYPSSKMLDHAKYMEVEQHHSRILLWEQRKAHFKVSFGPSPNSLWMKISTNEIEPWSYETPGSTLSYIPSPVTLPWSQKALGVSAWPTVILISFNLSLLYKPQLFGFVHQTAAETVTCQTQWPFQHLREGLAIDFFNRLT